MPSGRRGEPGPGTAPPGSRGKPCAGVPSGAPEDPGPDAARPGTRGNPNADVPSVRRGTPRAGVPSGTRGKPCAGVPSGSRGKPCAGVPSGSRGKPCAGVPSGTCGPPCAGTRWPAGPLTGPGRGVPRSGPRADWGAAVGPAGGRSRPCDSAARPLAPRTASAAVWPVPVLLFPELLLSGPFLGAGPRRLWRPTPRLSSPRWWRRPRHRRPLRRLRRHAGSPHRRCPPSGHAGHSLPRNRR